MKKPFENRYQRPVTFKDGTGAAKEIETIAKNYIEKMRKVPDRAKNITYFENIMLSSQRINELKDFKSKGGKIIGLFCNFVPEEIVYALGAIPVRLCSGSYPTITASEEVLSRDICPLVKSSFGLKIMKLSYIEICDTVVMPTSCDAKKKCSKFLNDYVPTLILDLPQSKDFDKNLSTWLKEIKILKDSLENFTKKKATKDSLKNAINLLHKRTELFRKFYETRKNNPYCINGRDSLLVIQSSFYDDINRWMENFEKLIKELEAKPKNEKDSIKLLITGAPIIWPNWKLLTVIEQTGATIVGDTLCTGTERLFNPVEVDEWTYDGMLRALSVKYLFPSICPCFIDNSEHIDRIMELTEDFKTDGVVYHTLRLCQQVDMEYNHISAVLKQKNIPLINITTDYSLEDEEQIKTRIEAFLEMLAQ